MSFEEIAPVRSTNIQVATVDSWNVYAGSTTGLKKTVNEDSLIVKCAGNHLQTYLADGHWGNKAAIIATSLLPSICEVFPSNKTECLEIVEKLQLQLYEHFGSTSMNEKTDLTPETSILAINIDQDSNLKLFSYGDCRLHVYRNGEKIYQMLTKQTWLGAFSYLGLRNRLSVAQGIIFDSIQLMPDDFILAFSDGIDECVYQIPTLGVKYFQQSLEKGNPKDIFETIMAEVFVRGAEDNASLAIIQM